MTDSSRTSPADAADQTMADGGATEASSGLTPEMVERLTDIRGKLQTSLAQVVIALSICPRYAYMPLKDLGELVIEPLMRERIALATPKPETASPLQKDTLAGIAIWATVSDEVDVKIRDQIRAGVFPVRLAPKDWTSGEKLWLLDVVAPTKEGATAVLQNFTTYVGRKPMHMHPVVGRAVDRTILERMGAKNESQTERVADPAEG